MSSALHALQDRLARSFGRAPDSREQLVRDMLSPAEGDAVGYWLQLAIAAILATLGLALNSTAVVIGAMLIAPLMRPLVELSMGLATGSAELSLRAAVRTVASIVVVVALAVALTALLPFHELTAELEARTGPTLLDLAVAGACALAAAYATLRAGADIATTAAGTSIGISLVPPLCAAGYGIAIGDLSVTRGAGLLFTANISGILALATVIFIAAGFGRVLPKRLGAFARIVPPLILLALVYLPLARAVREIQHRSEVRHTVAQLFERGNHRTVEYTIEHNASAVIVRAVIVGDARSAATIDSELRRRLARLGVEEPRISVWAVPDAASLSALTQRIDELPPPVAPEPAAATAHRFSTDIAAALRDAWPRSGTGEIIDISTDLEHPERVRITHLGAPLGEAGTQLLARAIESEAGKLAITEQVLLPVSADPPDGARWLPQALDLIRRARVFDSLHVCATVPAATVRDKRARAPSDIATIRAMLVQAIEGSTVTVEDGDHWSIAVQRDACAAPAGSASGSAR
ncbi:MAG TPA: DUF389 domain-containing protein [Kofleriaceae bacterium]|nr:DUF389 domain-containing protein [Kofleriaceae bacterium]